MRALGLIVGFAAACGTGGGAQSVSDGEPGEPAAPSEPGDGVASPGTPDGSTPIPNGDGGADDREPAPTYTPAFHVLEAFAEGVTPGQIGPVEILPYVSLFEGGPGVLFGITGGLLTGEGQLAAQVFRWSPGGDAQLLDDSTPWKLLRSADASGRWVVGERGTGLGDAQAFVWTVAGGFVELTIAGKSPVTVRGVSQDGSLIVGDAYGADGWQSYRWTATEGVGDIPLPPGYSRATSVLLSADGRSVFGTMEAESGLRRCFRQISPAMAEELELPTTLDGRELVSCGFRGVAFDGSAAAGSAIYLPDDDDRRTLAFHWSEGSGTRWIETPAGFLESAAVEISRDGHVVYGQLNVDTNSTPGDQPFRWTAESGTVPLGLLPGVRTAKLLAAGVRPRSDMSDEGDTVVGNSAFGASQGFWWSVRRGLVALQPLPGHTETQVTHLGANGLVAAGVSQGAEVEAVLWDETGKPRAVRTLLAEAGVDIGAFDFEDDFESGVAVFDAGKRVIGTGKTAEGVSAAWVALLP